MADQQTTEQPPSPQNDASVTASRFDGLKNTIEREDLGPRDLAQAVNVDIDDVGKLHRRRGRTKVASGDFHSLWNGTDGTVYGVKDGQLGTVNPDYSFTSLNVLVGGDYDKGSANVAFVQVGPTVYYSCSSGSGKINVSTKEVSAWGPPQDFWLSPVVIPSPTLPQIAGRLMGAMPWCSYLAYYNGRIYGAQGRMVWCTDLYTYDLVDKTRGFVQFEGETTMLGAVADGLYVGTNEGCWFLGGGEFSALKRVRVMDSPVIPGSMVLIPSELANPPQVGTEAVTPMQVSLAFMTTRGFCVAEDGGHAINLTERNYFFPVAVRATAFFRRQDGMNQYIVCADSEGQPVNGARFGDYVDAEIVRGKASWIEVDDSIKTNDGVV